MGRDANLIRQRGEKGRQLVSTRAGRAAVSTSARVHCLHTALKVAHDTIYLRA